MIIQDDFKEALDGKTLLFDTNFLTLIKNNPENEDVQNFLKFLNNSGCAVSISDFIKLEFLRDANRAFEYQARFDLLDILCEKFSLSVSDEIYRKAMLISFVYKKNGNKGIEFVDLVTSGLLYQYSNNLLLVTENHKDFPVPIHDRVNTLVFDLGKKLVRTIGFYQINKEILDAELEKLSHSKGWNK